ncbi:MAG TPA: elongation factor P maturation arginine rhamnosyltransferase EarP [Burkholderiaceae bacterium]|nr:elongation factor P maturation arginine rhamnosyltransferase EarP [Burkholderiaceae bacterium]
MADFESLRWDIFCHVVDNFGDIGVCWRLASQLARRGQSVRLWVDDPSALRWMAPSDRGSVQVLAAQPSDAAYEPGDVVVQAFGCPLAAGVPQVITRTNAHARKPVAWINLEYLSAEGFVARSHGLASPVHGGPAAGVHKWFFFPGFTADTGGLLREDDLMVRRAAFDRAQWLARQGVAWNGETVVALFCYEPPVLGQWLTALAGSPTCLLVTPGRAQQAIGQALAALPPSWNAAAAVKITFLPYLSQIEFDHLLWSADCNFVRGEDSLVRALWAGAALVWQAYPQQDSAHHKKLEAFLDWMPAPDSLRRFHRIWNGIDAGPLPALQLDTWRLAVDRARARLLAQDDLVSRLFQFLAKNR